MRISVLTALLLALPVCAQVKFTKQADRILVEIDGKPYTTFFLAPGGNKPYLYPLSAASGLVVTRHFPMETFPGETNDHPHHRGLFFSHGDVNGYNFWATEPGANDPKAGRMVVKKIVEAKDGKKSGTIRVVFDGEDPHGKPIMTETRTITFYSDPRLRTIDYEARIDAIEKLVFADTKEGTFGIRLATSMTEDKGGRMTNAEGKETEKNVWGKRSPWVDYAGQVDGHTVGVAIFDHPSDPRYPTYWHARAYGLFAANPFGVRDFTGDKSQDGSMTVEPGKTVIFRYRVVIHPGDFRAAGIAELYKQYAAAPREQERDQIKATLFVPSPLPALQTETYGQFEPAPGVMAERVSYATAYGLRVPAIVYRPKQVPAAKMPGIVVVNGHGGDKFSWYAFYTGILYARAGATVVTYDPIGEGERNLQRKNGTRQHDRTVEPPEMGRRMGGLMVTDVMQAVSYLTQRADTDPKRLAAVGYSMGSFVLGITCAVETRLNSCVLAGGGNLDGPGGYWDSSSKLMCQAIPYQSMMFLGDRGAVLYDLHADRGATLVINGTADDVVSIPRIGTTFFEDLRKRTVALHGSETNVFDFEWNQGGGHRPYFLTRPAALWLEKHLRFPNWTAASIASMPETHILEWAEKNHVPIDKLYATELREGGTHALGTGVPAVPHDDLNALPLERWNRDKDQYVYESWVKNARALLR